MEKLSTGVITRSSAYTTAKFAQWVAELLCQAQSLICIGCQNRLNTCSPAQLSPNPWDQQDELAAAGYDEPLRA